MNSSPRIHQLISHEYPAYMSPRFTDVTIIGGGIAGMMTAYHILKHTNLSVALIEGYKIAHGASGHNAGQITSYFERPFDDIVREYGIQLACEAQRDVFQARYKLEEIIDDLNMSTPYHKCMWYDGIRDDDEVMRHLDVKYLMYQWGLEIDVILIDHKWLDTHILDPKYHDVYLAVDQHKIQELLETCSTEFVAIEARKAGCMNSALAVQEMSEILADRYADRFWVYEHSPVSVIDMYADRVVCQICPTHYPDTYIHQTDRVILCTNGFEHIQIVNHDGQDIDTKFHEQVEWVVWYMCGFLQPKGQQPVAISYDVSPEELPAAAETNVEAYYYLTRRPYESDDGDHTLVCVWGPEAALQHKMHYDRDFPNSDSKQSRMSAYISRTYAPVAWQEVSYKYRRHGLMWYTRNTLRLIGSEPLNQRLMYNLGCNGVGILPSIHGAYKISKILAGEQFGPSIFDPQ